jgi:uncharacterized protein
MEDVSTDRAFYSIKLLPAGGVGEPLDLSDKVTSFEFEDAERKADRLLLKVDNWDLAEFDNPNWRKGGIIEFVFGYPGRMSPPRRGVIQKVHGGVVLTVEAHALSMLMHRVKKSRVWTNMTLAEIAATIAREYGSDLGVPNGTTGDNILVDKELDKKVPYRTQAAQTDAEFLTKLARRYGLEFYVDGSGLHFKRRNVHQAPIKTLNWYFEGNGEIISFDIDNDLTRKAGSHTLKGVDPLAKKQTKHTADNDTTKRDGLAPVIEIVDKRDGTITQQKLVDESIGHTSETTIHGARHQATGNFIQTQHTTIHLSAEIVGDPDVTGKRVVEIRGLGKRVSGKYYIQTATHEITPGGVYKTKFKAKTDGHGGYGNLNAKSKSALNKKEASDDTIEKVDSRTGTITRTYRKPGDQ